MRALVAKLRRRREIGAAVRARSRQRGPALLAELRLRAVLMLAARTAHAGASLHVVSVASSRRVGADELAGCARARRRDGDLTGLPLLGSVLLLDLPREAFHRILA